MKYERFEQLPVWQDAAKLAAELFVFCAKPLFRGKGDLASQLQRAALSISNNIAEGFERGTTKELISFLYYARGSAGEVRRCWRCWIFYRRLHPTNRRFCSTATP